MFNHLSDPDPPPFDHGFHHRITAGARARRRRRLTATGTAVVLGIAALGVGGMYARAASQVADIQRIEVGGTGPTAAGGPVTFLLLGTDGRPDSPPGYSDAMILARLDPGRTSLRLLSLPRDLDVSQPGEPTERLNTVIRSGGPDMVVRQVERLGFDVDHVVIIDLDGFVALIDELGGLDLQIDAPVRDDSTGLSIGIPGCVHFDGLKALALVRARHLEVFDGTHWRSDQSGDLGRTERQRSVLLAALHHLGHTAPDPLTANQLASWARHHVILDEELSDAELVELLGSMAGVDPASTEAFLLPVVEEQKSDGAIVLRTTADLARTVARFQGSDPAADLSPSIASEGTTLTLTACTP